MKITRQTYESFFLLYVDGELNAEERSEVEQFIQENPDLKEELEMLKGVVIRPENDIVFGDTASLLKNSNPVTIENCEEYFVLYGDDELTKEEKEFTEQFVYHHPEQQQNFELIMEARMVPDRQVIFADKESLYRTEKTVRIIPFKWYKIAAAAAVLLFVAGMGWYSYDKKNNSDQMATVKPTDRKTPDVPAIKPEATPEIAAQTPPVKPKEEDVVKQQAQKIKPVQVDHDLVAKHNIKKEKKSPAQSNKIEQLNVPHESVDMAVENKAKFKAEEGVDVKGTSNVTSRLPIIDQAISERQLAGQSNLQPATTSYAELQMEPDNNIIYVANTSVSKKNKLRGLLRKATRVFERATNIQPSDENKGIRIANLEFALK